VQAKSRKSRQRQAAIFVTEDAPMWWVLHEKLNDIEASMLRPNLDLLRIAREVFRALGSR